MMAWHAVCLLLLIQLRLWVEQRICNTFSMKWDEAVTYSSLERLQQPLWTWSGTSCMMGTLHSRFAGLYFSSESINKTNYEHIEIYSARAVYTYSYIYKLARKYNTDINVKVALYKGVAHYDQHRLWDAFKAASSGLYIMSEPCSLPSRVALLDMGLRSIAWNGILENLCFVMRVDTITVSAGAQICLKTW